MASRSVALCFVLIAVGCVHSTPAKPAFWKGTPVDGLVEEMRSMCNDENDSFSCMKFKVMNFLDTILKKDNYKVNITYKNIYNLKINFIFLKSDHRRC